MAVTQRSNRSATPAPAGQELSQIRMRPTPSERLTSDQEVASSSLAAGTSNLRSGLGRMAKPGVQ